MGIGCASASWMMSPHNVTDHGAATKQFSIKNPRDFAALVHRLVRRFVWASDLKITSTTFYSAQHVTTKAT